MMDFLFRGATLRGLLLLGAAFAANADDIRMAWQPSGVAKTVGYYRVMRLALSPVKPAGIKAVPADLAAPLYGRLQLGPAEAPTSFFVVLDEPDGKPPRLFVDANANGDLTDDPPAEWNAQPVKTNAMGLPAFKGGAYLNMTYGSEKLKFHMAMFRLDKHDARYAEFTNSLFYYRDYGRAGDVPLGGKSYHAMLLDNAATGDFRPDNGAASSTILLLLDLNNDGKFERRGETFDVAKPFNIGGTNYQITNLTASGGSFQIVNSSQKAPETLPGPVLTAGAKSLPFEVKTTDGNTVRFPESYKGRLVLLDFWATWCGPCGKELPYLTNAYGRFHGKGFDILGVSLDRANASGMLAKFTKKNNMPWPEVYDGNLWKTAVAKTYEIEAIPYSFLVDGDTGIILAGGGELRGEKLSAAIEKALAKRSATQRQE